MVAERLRMGARSGERCPWRVRCIYGLDGRCNMVHLQEEVEHFATKREIQSKEACAECAFCIRDCCKFKDRCWRGLKDDSDYDGSDEGERGVSGGDTSEETVAKTVPDEVHKASAVQESRWATALKVEGAQFRRLTEADEMNLQEGERPGCVFDTAPSDPNQGPGGFYVPLRELGSRT